MGVAVPVSLELLRRLIAFPTVSRDSNIELIEFARAHLESAGAVTRLTFDDGRRKANLFASLGPADVGGIVLSGHTDVVPVDGQAWSSDPFVLREKDDRYYGRGCADMKGFVAVALAFAPEFARRGLRRRRCGSRSGSAWCWSSCAKRWRGRCCTGSAGMDARARMR